LFSSRLPGLLGGRRATPAVDFVEREKEYEISAELPGLDEKNVANAASEHQYLCY
jgi:HSP20 family protein